MPDPAPARAPQLLTLEEAASVLQCHRTTIGRLVAQGDLACIRYSDRPGARMLFTMDLLSDFLRRRATRPRPESLTSAPAATRRTRRTTGPSPWEESTPTSTQLW